MIVIDHASGFDLEIVVDLAPVLATGSSVSLAHRTVDVVDLAIHAR